MSKLQLHKLELRIQQIAILKNLAMELRQVMFNCVDASASNDLTDAILATNKALRKLKA